MGLRLPDRLPELSGPVLMIYRFGWPVLLLLALVSVVYLVPVDEMRAISQSRAFYEIGLAPTGRTGKWQKVRPFAPEAHAAGVKRGDLIIAIEGRPALIDQDGVMAMLKRPNGAPVQLTLRGADGAARDVTLHRDRAYLDATYARVGLTYGGRRMAELAIMTVGSLLGLTVAALLYLRRKRDPVAALLAIGATVNSIGVWSLTSGWASLVAQEMLMRAIVVIIWTLIPIAILVFPSGRFSPRWSWLGVPLVMLHVGLLQAGWGNNDYDIPGMVTLVALLALGVGVIVARFRAEAAGVAKQQIKFAMLGLAGMAIFYSLSFVFSFQSRAATDEGIRAWLILGANGSWSLGYISLQLGLLVSLLRFRLYDAETAISRSAVIAALTLFLGFIFAASEKLLEAVGQSYFGDEGRGSAAAISAVLAATLIAPLHGRISRWAERRFQKALIALRERLPMLVGDLRETASPGQLADIALERIESGVRASHGAVVLGKRLIAVRDLPKADATAWLKAHPLGKGEQVAVRDEGDPLFPMRVALDADGCGRVGWLLLGPRPDGSTFGKDEREVLAEIADPVARALAISAARKQDTNKRQRELEGLRALVTALETRLVSVEVKLA